VPNLVVVAGPNDAGKSTVAPMLLRGRLGISEFLNADVIARGLSEFNPEGVAIEAGRVMLRRLRELARRQVDFAFETTLASRVFAPWIGTLIEDGYVFWLVYVWVASPELCIARVAERARTGGHDVPADVVRRRYTAGLKNFFHLYRPLAASWQVYDNSSAPIHLVAEAHRGETSAVYDHSAWSTIMRGFGDGQRRQA
jgi:predicted ABC-type ATPase